MSGYYGEGGGKKSKRRAKTKIRVAELEATAKVEAARFKALGKAISSGNVSSIERANALRELGAGTPSA